MTAPERFAYLVFYVPARAVRVANLVKSGYSITRAIVIVKLADKESYR